MAFYPNRREAVNTILKLFQRGWARPALCNPERSAKSNFSPRLWYLQSACCRGSRIGCCALACADDASATGQTRRGKPPTTDHEIHLQAENSRVSLASSRLNP